MDFCIALLGEQLARSRWVSARSCGRPATTLPICKVLRPAGHHVTYLQSPAAGHHITYPDDTARQFVQTLRPVSPVTVSHCCNVFSFRLLASERQAVGSWTILTKWRCSYFTNSLTSRFPSILRLFFHPLSHFHGLHYLDKITCWSRGLAVSLVSIIFRQLSAHTPSDHAPQWTEQTWYRAESANCVRTHFISEVTFAFWPPTLRCSRFAERKGANVDRAVLSRLRVNLQSTRS